MLKGTEKDEKHKESDLEKSSSLESAAEFLKFIPKEDPLFQHFQTLNTSSQSIQKQDRLLNAIQSKQFDDDIFSDPNCHLVAEILYAQGKITKEQSITILIYISALQEHTLKQPLREEDQDLKDIKEVKVHFPFDQPESDSFIIFTTYLKRMNRLFSSFGWATFNIDQMIEYAKNLVESEQCFFSVESIFTLNPEEVNKHYWEKYAETQFLKTALDASGLVINIPERKIYVIPSASLICLLLNTTSNGAYVNLTTIYGCINHKTLHREFHQQYRHPLNGYSIYTTTKYIALPNNTMLVYRNRPHQSPGSRC